MSTHDFVRQNENVMLGADLGNRGQLLPSEDLSRRVVRGVDDDDLGLVRERSAGNDQKNSASQSLPHVIL